MRQRIKMVAEENNAAAQLSSSSASDHTKLWTTFNNRIFKDVAGDVTIVVNGESYLLHKFPLVSRSGKIRKMVADAKDSKNQSKFEIHDLVGGYQAFELAAKFCYGMNFEITAGNVAHLRCVAEYLEMTEDYQEDNLIARTEAYLDEVMVHSIEKSMEVLITCESLPDTILQHLNIPKRCIDAIARKTCKEQQITTFNNSNSDDSSTELNKPYTDWWIEDLSTLRIDFYQQIISSMTHYGINATSVIASVIHYAQIWLKGIGKLQIWNPARLRSNFSTTNELDQKIIVETLVHLLPTEKLIPLTFLFGLLRMAIIVGASGPSRAELEKRVGFRLEMVLLDDLLIPSVYEGDSLFDVDTVGRILQNFLQKIDGEEDEDEDKDEELGLGFGSPSHGSLLKVGLLIDAYLAEIGPDPNLSVRKFSLLIEMLPDYARVIDDGIYRAIDIYLKAHPTLTEEERKTLCTYIDCQKLSQEASNHAAKNDRLPVLITVRVLYHEQLRLRNAMSASSEEGPFSFSQKISSGIPSAAMSPRDTYASMRRENRELKLEISRLRMRLNDLEKQQNFMKQEMINRSGNGNSFFESLSKGIGMIGIFTAKSGNKGKKASRSCRVRRESVS